MSYIERRELYKQQLDEWIKKSKLTKSQIAELTLHLNFRDGKISPSTVGRITKEIPARYDRALSLIELLGVLYAMNAVNSNGIVLFWKENDIVELPEEYTWNQIWAEFERAKPNILENVNNYGLAPSRSVNYHLRHARAILLLCSLVLIAVLLLIGDRFSTVSICHTYHGEIAPSIFLPDQGISLYTPSKDFPESSVLNTDIRTIDTNEDGVWVGYANRDDVVNGVSYYNKLDEHWWHCLDLNLVETQTINDFEFLGDSVFVATDGAGIAELRNGEWIIHTQDKGLPSNVVYTLEVDGDGELLTGTLEGVAKRSGEQWGIAYRARVGELVNNQIHDILIDSSNNKWFGSVSHGVSRLSPLGVWETYFADTDSQGLNNVRAMVEDDEQGIWIAADGGGAARYYGGEWAVFTTENGLPGNDAQDIEKDKYGRIWVATNHGVAFTADYGQTWTIHSQAATVDIEFGCLGCPYDDNHIWLAIKDVGLGHTKLPPIIPVVEIDSPEFVQIQAEEDYVFEVRVQALTEDLTTADGLFSTDPETAESYGAARRIPVAYPVHVGERYIFTNINDPIHIDMPGAYRIPWRIWQGGRYVSDTIWIEFEVVAE